MHSLILIFSAFRDLIRRFLPAAEQKDSFAFIVHPRNSYDAANKYPFLKFLPELIVNVFLKHLWPIVAAEVHGLKSINGGEEIKGWIIGVPLTPKQMLEDRTLANKRILQAVKLAEKMGVTIVGLGGMTASLTEGGYNIANNNSNVGVTTGRAYTAYIVASNFFELAKYFNIDLKKGKFAIVGGGGSIGLACAELLVRGGVDNLLLIDLVRKSDRIKQIIDLLKSVDTDRVLSVNFSSTIHDIIESDIIIAATSSPEAVIQPDDLKPGAIIIDDAQPSDVDPAVLKERTDVLVINGGVVKTKNISYKLNLKLAGRNDIFSCLAEAMALSANRWRGHYALGWLDLNLIGELKNIGEKLGFELAEFQNKYGYISDEQLKKIKEIRSQYYNHL